jgi:dipeptidyl aminopeptidase/acylaminoacyl peptidase
MISRRNLLKGFSAVALTAHQVSHAIGQDAMPRSALDTGKKGVMLMNRIGPSSSELYIANSDGAGERKLLRESVFDYHASYSADGKWIVFTSERTGLGQADIYRARSDGTEIERLTDSEAVDDQAALSPDGTLVAFVSTREGYKANIWILDLKTKQLRNLTGQSGIQGDPDKPGGFFRPSWSPDGQWLAFSSDRNTEWRARKGAWEHVQELSVYLIRETVRACAASRARSPISVPDRRSGRPTGSGSSSMSFRWSRRGMHTGPSWSHPRPHRSSPSMSRPATGSSTPPDLG